MREWLTQEIKHCNRALRIHKLLLESLERLLFCTVENQMNYIEELNDDSYKGIELNSETLNADNLNNTISNQELQRLYQM